MFYKKNLTKDLSIDLFKNPTSEYRATPFWAWNSNLDKDELSRQIETFKKMGFGGFHMHVRQGLTVEYLGQEFLSAIKFCTKKAESLDMLAWLYDEDRWPSGVAGGEITKNKEFRQKFITMSVSDKADCAKTPGLSAQTGRPYFLTAFSVTFDDEGKVVDYLNVERTAECKNKYYFFIEQQQGGEPRYNYQSYVDVLNKNAIDAFINYTHEKFKSAVGDKFGKSVPALFTDEPQFFPNFAPVSAKSQKVVRYAWTTDFNETFKSACGFDLLERLPELFFDTDIESAKETRYHYFTHLSERFCSAYMDNIGKWCEQNNIAFTGHLMGEDTLYEQALSNGDVMRAYKNMQLPGIDMLCDDVEFNTAVQCRSAVRQYGREAMLSELYGVTGWDFDFRGHKYQGDWQACLGVTVRVPYLAWQSMKGEGKRDYPAPISYQSPWHEQYRYIEDHYARVNTAMTRGTPIVNIAVIHPIDTYKTVYASLSETLAIREELEQNFRKTTEWLLTGGFDFDFISQSLLPDLCKNGSNPLSVGKMQYDTIILSDCTTLTPYTVKILTEFKKSGGKLIFIGRLPEYINGVKNDALTALTDDATVILHSKADLYRALSGKQNVKVTDSEGCAVNDLIYSMRQDGDCRWLFSVHAVKTELPHLINGRELAFTVNGKFTPELYDTLSGEIKDLDFDANEDKTTFYLTVYDLDSVLVKLTPRLDDASVRLKKDERNFSPLPIEYKATFRLSEPNVLLLDMAKYSADNGELKGPEEIMRIDADVRAQFNLQSRRTKVVQPWAVPDAPEDHTVKLVYEINSEIDYDRASLALEHPHNTTITFNGVAVNNSPNGYYIDRDIKTVALPPVKKGLNVLELSMPFGLRTDLESCYLIGEFGATYSGRETKLIPLPEKLNFGDVTRQGLAFYGGNIEYDVDLELEKTSDIKVTTTYYRGAVIQVLIDGVEQGKIAFQPFSLIIPKVSKGKHKLTLILNGTRYNTFSALHNTFANKKRMYLGPDYWRSENNAWAYEYETRSLGILKTPIIEISEN
ncbi:MAG: hypothetical protein IJV95_00980 [Clostridia bacterium]|nr:hypothetical protein [Clostridia bacterium]